jgi:cytochrome c-type biogenesis protein
MNEQISLIGVFAAGVISFLSPCVLPLIPAYLAYISGKSVEELESGACRSFHVLTNSFVFVLGFTCVFVLLGATASQMGQFLIARLEILTKIAGGVIVLLGLSMLGLFRLPIFSRTFRVQFSQRPPGLLGSFLIGMAFALGWTPCIGPILAGVLAYAATSETMWQGVWLLMLYSLGLGIPFILTSIFLERFLLFTSAFKKHYHKVEIASGILLILVGILIYSGSLSRLIGYLGFFNRFSL